MDQPPERIPKPLSKRSEHATKHWAGVESLASIFSVEHLEQTTIRGTASCLTNDVVSIPARYYRRYGRHYNYAGLLDSLRPH